MGLLPRRRLSVSSALTPLDMQATVKALPATATATHRQALEELLDSMHVFTAALYGTADLDGTVLDQALAAARSATGRAPSR